MLLEEAAAEAAQDRGQGERWYDRYAYQMMAVGIDHSLFPVSGTLEGTRDVRLLVDARSSQGPPYDRFVE